MFESFILGAVQGVAEWLPISSEAVLVLVQLHWLGGESLPEMIKVALFFHLGTFLAVVVYFWDEILSAGRKLLSYRKHSTADRAVLNFYIISTLLSGVLGGGLFFLIEKTFADLSSDIGHLITLLVGVMLLITAGLQFSHKFSRKRKNQQLVATDSVLVGLGQGLSALPGVSRSGTTVSIMLLRGVDKTEALKHSFILSLPIVLGGNIFLNFSSLEFGINQLVGLLSAFIFGTLTIHLMMRLVERVKFGWVVLFFALLTLVAVFI